MNRKNLLALVALVVLATLALAACATDPSPSDVGASATATLTSPDGDAMGTVTLAQTYHGVLVSAEVSGLVPGGHGFHIHTVGTCAPDFAAAGDHFNPGDVGHGYNNPDGVHAGDLPNIYANAEGAARADYFTTAITLDADADHSIFDADGSAIIVHEKPDTYGADAGAGGRVACGVIQRN